MERSRSKVCVTGGASYIGSCLVKKLLEKGYVVHATLRNLKDESKTSVLRGLPHANDERLVLFQADVYRPHEFEPAIQGCHFVFHVATPYAHQPASQEFENQTEAAKAAVKSIVEYSIKSGTVKRLIYTASVVAASPLKDDGTGFKHFIDETCWTPLNVSFPYSNLHKSYYESKTVAERELLSYEGDENGIEIVNLACGLVGGDSSFLNFTPMSVAVLISPIIKDENEFTYQSLRFIEELDGKVPIVHIDDVCEAHIFCAEINNTISGRYLVASSYVSSAYIANYCFQAYPLTVVKYLEGSDRKIKWASTKLTDKGFVYKYDLAMILDDSITCAKRTGHL